MSDSTLLAEVMDADPERRRAALKGLAISGNPLDEGAIAMVVACLDTPLKVVQRLAADLLDGVDPDARCVVVARLRTALRSADPRLRWGAVYALGRLGLVELPMIPPSLEALAQRDGDVRWAAADLLATCARVHPERVVSALLAAATDQEPERRKMALYVLRDVAPEKDAVHAAVLQGLRDPAVGVRCAALSALARLEPTPLSACDLVLGLVRHDPDPGLRRAALCALGILGRGVRNAEAEIASAATSDDRGMRRAAQIARCRLGQ
jgi:HEAT repeat protein